MTETIKPRSGARSRRAVTVRLSESEERSLDRLAEASGMTRSEYLRHMLAAQVAATEKKARRAAKAS